MFQRQKTIKKKVSYSGIALHTGNKTRVSFLPAPHNYGIEFVRIDLANRPVVKAKLENVTGVTRGTTIEENGVKVHTVEHVLAALMGCGIDNLIIEMEANEPPVADGSSLAFVEMIKEAGIQEQSSPKKSLKLMRPIYYEEGGASLVALPYEGCRISFTLSYKDTRIKDQYYTVEVNEENFIKEIAPCRTFCFYHEVEYLMKEGLIKGGSLDNAVVVGRDAIFSKEKLRFPDECVRHKILDIIGDLYLLGKPFKAHVIAIKSGHAMNFEFAKRLLGTLTQEDLIHEFVTS
ncbi:MAG: UDP-3-O-[3-hydroxymyristoyl] N-acetylglucosamine deacetylase [Chlamydiae bacterium]|nr:UDP-3-O-[3-hydroxymyristoyl] N-acetylglucosamine deacetylase [Chlamydiota bacterium]MBI3277546.1 UDP-3-O-[3-hydroxymyristoyl] N-acetylglucosamine deacetylase [Chlamydiota bacterium]